MKTEADAGTLPAWSFSRSCARVGWPVACQYPLPWSDTRKRYVKMLKQHGFWSIWSMRFGPLPTVPPVTVSASRYSSSYPIHGHTDDIKHLVWQDMVLRYWNKYEPCFTYLT
jgi:hypothetical protein